MQVQKDGLKAINDGNETLAYLTDLITEGLRSSELAWKAQTLAIENLTTKLSEIIDYSTQRSSDNLNILGDRICRTLFAIHSLKTKGYIYPREKGENDDHQVPEGKESEWLPFLVLKECAFHFLNLQKSLLKVLLVRIPFLKYFLPLFFFTNVLKYYIKGIVLFVNKK